MLNYLWAGMILIGIFYGAFTGNMENISNAALESAKDAVNLCITMLGVMGVWVGLMKIAENAGIVKGMTKILMPFAKFMFPNVDKDSKAMEYMCTNMAANILGLGWAATPAGLKAMEALSELEAERGNEEYLKTKEKIRESGMEKKKKNSTGRTASVEMCTFLVINISSLQLIPVNMIAYRSQYGSVNPAGIIAPAIVATLIGTFVAVIFCKIMQRQKKA